MKALTTVTTFLKQVREELLQVAWPNREELIGSVVVVFVGVFFLATFVSVCDLILSHAARFLLR